MRCYAKQRWNFERESEMGSEANSPFGGANTLIFGGAKGIGKAVAQEWAERGARLAIADIDLVAAQETADEIEKAGGMALALPTNVLSMEAMEVTVAEAEGNLGEIDIVMNNVGAILNGHPVDIPMEEWHRIFELNYFAVVRSNNIFIPKMRARGQGHIVNTASFAGLYPYAAGRIPYASSKAAVISMTENLALLLEPDGIKVSCLIPGPTVTNIMDGMKSWTPDLPMYAGGSELTLQMPQELARILADGMQDGKILIAADERVWEIVQRRAADPEAFVRSKMSAFAEGDYGSPTVPETLLKVLQQQG